MDVTGARRGIQHEIIQFAPVGIGYQLFQRVAGHTATPQRSLIRVYKETDGKQFDTVFLDRYNQVATVHFFGIRTGVFHLEHLRHRRTEDIRIEQTYLVA